MKQWEPCFTCQMDHISLILMFNIKSTSPQILLENSLEIWLKKQWEPCFICQMDHISLILMLNIKNTAPDSP